MKYPTILAALTFFLSTAASAQKLHLGVFAGASNYQGDLVDGAFSLEQTKGAAGVTAHYELTDHIDVRGGFMFGKIAGADRFSSSSELRARNLSFQSSIIELSVQGVYNAFSLYQRRYTPYFFAGIAVFHFNPYTYDAAGNQVFLKPLSTEGQGLAGYPDRKPYKLTQLSIPFGGGFKYAINDNIRISLEMGIRKTFTDYLDDVSTEYADPADLLAGPGAVSVDLSYRGDELPGGDPNYPAKGQVRGGSEFKDYYYFTGLHLSFRLPGNGYRSSNGVRGQGCPAVPL